MCRQANFCSWQHPLVTDPCTGSKVWCQGKKEHTEPSPSTYETARLYWCLVAGSGSLQAWGSSTQVNLEDVRTDRRECSWYHGAGWGGELVHRTNYVFIRLPAIYAVASECYGISELWQVGWSLLMHSLYTQWAWSVAAILAGMLGPKWQCSVWKVSKWGRQQANIFCQQLGNSWQKYCRCFRLCMMNNWCPYARCLNGIMGLRMVVNQKTACNFAELG